VLWRRSRSAHASEIRRLIPSHLAFHDKRIKLYVTVYIINQIKYEPLLSQDSKIFDQLLTIFPIFHGFAIRTERWNSVMNYDSYMWTVCTWTYNWSRALTLSRIELIPVKSLFVKSRRASSGNPSSLQSLFHAPEKYRAQTYVRNDYYWPNNGDINLALNCEGKTPNSLRLGETKSSS